jgi:hypothetical protein
MQIQITLQTIGKCTHPQQPIHETPLTQPTEKTNERRHTEIQGLLTQTTRKSQ